MVKNILKKMIFVVLCMAFCFGLNSAVLADKEDDSLKPELNYIDEETGIRFYAEEGAIPKDARIVITPIIPGLHKEDDENYRKALKNLDEDKKKEVERLELYKIEILNKDNMKVRETGLVRVMIPINKNFDEKDLEILKIVSGKDVTYDKEITTFNGQKYCVFQNTQGGNISGVCCLVDKLVPNESIQRYIPYFVYAGVLSVAGVLFVIIKNYKTR